MSSLYYALAFFALAAVLLYYRRRTRAARLAREEHLWRRNAWFIWRFFRYWRHHD